MAKHGDADSLVTATKPVESPADHGKPILCFPISILVSKWLAPQFLITDQRNEGPLRANYDEDPLPKMKDFQRCVTITYQMHHVIRDALLRKAMEAGYSKCALRGETTRAGREEDDIWSGQLTQDAGPGLYTKKKKRVLWGRVARAALGGLSKKCRISGSTPELLNQNMRSYENA